MNKRKSISQLILILAVSAMVGFYFLTANHPDQEAMLEGASIGFILIALLAERFVPFDSQWNHSLAESSGDIAVFTNVFGALDGLLKWMTPFAIIAFSSIYQPASVLPFWIEVILVILAIELMAWISHWLHHRFRPLWALHAMHHAPEKLYTLNNFRFHPLNHIFNHAFMLVPVLLLGFSAEAVLFYTIISLPILALQHSNINFDFGIFDTFINTNVVHRYHHSTKASEGMSNLGRATLLWDHVFRTYHRPDGQQRPKRLGLFKESLKHYPTDGGIIRQVAWPFSKACCA